MAPEKLPSQKESSVLYIPVMKKIYNVYIYIYTPKFNMAISKGKDRVPTTIFRVFGASTIDENDVNDLELGNGEVNLFVESS